MSNPVDKPTLRDQLRRRLAAVAPEDAAAWSRAACERAMAEPEFRRAQAVMAYVPMAGEPDIRPVLDAVLAAGKVLCLPRLAWVGRTLTPVRVESMEGLVVGRHGVPEPPLTAPEFPVAELDVIVVPGVAFDLRGGRMGRGAGFYDRLLGRADRKATTFAVCFELQVVESAPMESHDQRVDVVVTEARVARSTEGH